MNALTTARMQFGEMSVHMLLVLSQYLIRLLILDQLYKAGWICVLHHCIAAITRKVAKLCCLAMNENQQASVKATCSFQISINWLCAEMVCDINSEELL